ncbi:hypothetical protein QQF64_031904 [Cirrhinus molitorella]|uniref:Ig-like domain-containing protein n=1 Tax=Cirrhinus molitorella TaxID=172907 RepID=A0ABR3MYB6_9TELE
MRKYNLVAVFLSALFETVHGHYGYVQIQCRVPDSQQHVEFIFTVTYNMIEYLRYNKFVLDQCKKVGQYIVPLSDKTVPPEVIIRLDNVNQKAILVCSAYDFYPKPIRLTWIRDDQVMAADVTSIEEQDNGDWFYQIHSHLEYFPKPGEKISCVVEHASSNKPMIYHWDPSLPESEKAKIILGAVGLSIGVFMAAGGLIYYKRKHTGFYRLPVCLLPMQTMNETEQHLELELQVIFVAVQTVGNTERLLDSCVRIQKPPPSEVPPSSVLAREPRARIGRELREKDNKNAEAVCLRVRKGLRRLFMASTAALALSPARFFFFSLSGAHAEQEPELIGFHSQVSESAVNSDGGSLRGPLYTSSPAG